mmetsp:Transcript_3424/g.5670  ORF Transcript_3424/g.5670 Transcript_3424/m.5670 type:complete len:469 (-) Transcript_3424:133-1539(-)|eukprot:CAMPEP_0119014040 /NCGR_PEP_ID=MMETSP1176-20130426/9320_1 /TAXON_ID=265551 /ORGANISM="Synedropsis recta cf, Strain CCMP1620" /LENGTH=468 /DNA_ID=CAMNT_0006967175 /DNA_START=48 /DNA_END=1454 /DNA_ORIENTATION=-
MVGFSSSMSTGKEEYEVDYDKNITRLYEAITNCDWDIAIDAVNEMPRESRTWVVRHYEDTDDIMWRFLPIHSACARQPPAPVISALLKAYPEGARSIDDQGMYPLHYACGNQASREVVRLLLVANPQAAKITDPRGMLPIHYLSCWGPSSVSIIDMVLVANRDVGKTTDADGNTALDLAKEGDYPEKDAVVAALKRWFDKSKEYESSSPRSDRSGSKLSYAQEPTVSRSSYDAPSVSKSSYDMAPGLTKSSSTDSNGRESPLTVGRLRQEVAKLRSEQKKREEDHESKMTSSVSSLKSQCFNLERKVSNAANDLGEARSTAKNLEAALKRKERESTDKDDQLEELTKRLLELETERDDLRQTLTDVTDDAENHRRKADNMNDRIGSLSASLSSMMDQQADLMKTINSKESRAVEDASTRRKKLQALMDLEDRMIAASKFDNDTTVSIAFEKQAKEMDAIAAVIAAIRQ